jgi:hypothetical protein
MQTVEEQKMHLGIQLYCNSLEEIKLRIKAVQSVVNKKVSLDSFGHEYFVDEFVFLQIRKILELIAFGSMSSNIVRYESNFKDFAGHWKAKKILEKLESINPDFYPCPMQPIISLAGSDKDEIENVMEGFLTIDDFEFLYDAASEIIHSSNPYKEAKKIDLKISIDDWMHRIASLLWFHQIILAGTNTSWFVYLMHPETNRVMAQPCQSLPREKSSQ